MFGSAPNRSPTIISMTVYRSTVIKGNPSFSVVKPGMFTFMTVYRIQFLRHVEGGIHAASPRRMRRCAAGVR